MSLINKMLQDLDARGGSGAKAGGEAVRSVAPTGMRSPAMLAVRSGVALTALAVAAWYGWTQMHKGAAYKAPKAAGATASVAQPAVPATVATVPTMATVAAAPAASAPATVAAATGQVTPGAADSAAQAAAKAAQEASRTTRAERLEARRKRETERQGDLAAQLSDAKRKAREARAEAHALAAAHVQANKAAAAAAPATAVSVMPAVSAAPVQPRVAAKAVPPRDAETSGVTVTSQQQADNAYKRALASLQEGRVQDAVSSLEQAVYAYPRHDAARQALVGLLLEARRNDEAIRHLQLGLGLDPKQQQMAMLLARLQIERGGPAAVETLMRTLPYAGNNPDYLAFLAGALQKGQRHKEAVEQYQAALRLMPQNGVWWMGMGISLQADKRNTEAADAYSRAKASGSLSPELVSFVERKLAQMAR